MISANGLTIGDDGSGMLQIIGGGRVQSALVLIGARDGGSGVVKVSGASSTLDLTGPLHIGGASGSPGGMATLDIEQGGTVFVPLVADLYPGGHLRLLGGTLDVGAIRRFQGGGEFVWGGGTLHVGTFEGDLVNEGLFPDGGTLAPGHSAGITTIQGDYTQRARGTLEVEIGGTQQGTEFDVVSVTGDALLSGSLKLDRINGFVPNPAQTFVVLSANTLSGEFVNAPNGERVTTSDGRGSFIVHYGAGSAFEPAQIVLTDFLPTTPGDCNLTGAVGLLDHKAFVACMLGPLDGVGPECRCFDLNGDASVDLADFAEFQELVFGE